MKPEIDINRVLTSAIDAAFEGDQQPRRRYRGVKALAAGAALVTVARAGQTRLPGPVKFGLKKLVPLPDVSGMADTVRDRFADGADALRERFTDHGDLDEDFEAPEDLEDFEDFEDEEPTEGDEGPEGEGDEGPEDDGDEGPEDEGDEDSEDEEFDDDEDSEDEEFDDEEPADEDESSDEEELPDEDESVAAEESDEGPQAEEPEDDEDTQSEPRDLALDLTQRAGGNTPDLFEALSARHPRPPLMQALSRRSSPAERPPEVEERTTGGRRSQSQGRNNGRSGSQSNRGRSKRSKSTAKRG